MLDNVEREYLESCSEESFRKTFSLWQLTWQWIREDQLLSDSAVEAFVAGKTQEVNLIAQLRNIDLGAHK